jgi:hypothetical protein
VISIVQSKTLRPKRIVINLPAKEALNRLQESRYGDYLFMSRGFGHGEG